MTKKVYLRYPDGLCIATDSPDNFKGAVRITKKQYDSDKQTEARRVLLKYFRPGDTAYTVMLHRSQSGMSRRIAVIATTRDTRTDAQGKKRVQWVPVDVSFYVANLLGWPADHDKGGVKVSGCGMDMGFHLVYSMASRLFPDGTKEPHGRRNGEPDSTGGYAVNHRWL